MNNKLLKILQPTILLVVVSGFFILQRESFNSAKIIHLLALISWFAGLFYLPRLFVYHAMSERKSTPEPALIATLKVMEHKLFYYIMTPAMVLTIVAGFWMVDLWQWTFPVWLHIKLTAVALLLIYHYQCWRVVNRFKENTNNKSHIYYRYFNEIPTVLLIAIVILVVVKPIL
jgi:putative membrane protein